MRRNQIFSYEEVKEIIEGFGFELISKEYLKNSKKLLLKDNEGYLYTPTLANLKNNHPPRKFQTSNLYTIKNIKLWIQLNNKNFGIIDNQKYQGSHVKLKWLCLKEECGEIFDANWNDISHNKGCPFCSGVKVGLSNCLATKRPDIASEWHPIKNGNLTPYDVTCGCRKYAWWQCKDNPKHEWHVTILNRSNGNGCPYCSHRYASEDYNLLVINPNLCEDWNYDKNKKKPKDYTPGSSQSVWWLCKECGHEWKAIIADRNNNHGCPECNKSKGEKRCKEVFLSKDFIETLQGEYKKLLDKNKYNNTNTYFIPQKTFEDLIGLGGGLLSYDFYIPKYNLLIEYQGQFHDGDGSKGNYYMKKNLKRQQEHDRRKREYAKQHNINLLEIWYWDFDRIEEILTNYLN